MTPERRGLTLLELLVVLAILGLVGTLVVFAPAAVEQAPPTDLEVRIARARREALQSGAAVTIDVVVEGKPHSVTALPDGSVLAEPSLGVDRMTGQVGAM